MTKLKKKKQQNLRCTRGLKEISTANANSGVDYSSKLFWIRGHIFFYRLILNVSNIIVFTRRREKEKNNTKYRFSPREKLWRYRV